MKKCPYCAEEILAEAIKCKHCGTMLGPDPTPADSATEGPFTESDFETNQSGKFCRSTTNSMLSGVCGGLAKYLGIDPTWVRIAWVVLCIPTGIFPMVIAYFVMAMIVPDDQSLEDNPTAPVAGSDVEAV